MKDFKLRQDTINRFSIPAARNFKTCDITEPPVTSPVNISAGSTQILKVPKNAAEISIHSANDVLISEDSNNFVRYDIVPGGMKETIGIVDRKKFYLKNNGSSPIDVYFRFNTL